MNNKSVIFRKFFWFGIMPILWIVVAKAISLRFLDRPVANVTPTRENIENVDRYVGEKNAWFDYRALFNLRQEIELLPAEQNGWREVMRVLGPRAFDRADLLDCVAWENFPTDERTKTWFEQTWVPLCEKFDIDPKKAPTTLKWLDLRAYLGKNGITGRETPLDKSPENVESLALYWENGRKNVGRATNEEIEACLERLERNPWTANRFPVAAKWIKENDELYRTLAEAVRAPKFGAWRVLSNALGRVDSTDSSDLKGIELIASMFLERANLRVASGELDGVVDDVEVLLRLARFQLDSNNRFLTDRLVGLALLESALSVGFYANPNAQPTVEQTNRWDLLWREFFNDYDFAAVLSRVVNSIRDGVALLTVQDICLRRRELGSVAELMAELTDSDSWKERARKKGKLDLSNKGFLFRATFDDAFMMQTTFDLFERLRDSLAKAEKMKFDPVELLDLPGAKKRTVEASIAATVFEAAVKPLENFAELLRRIACLTRMHMITNALLAYQQNVGTLPPAFSVDPREKPLLSWRVLILPYLGDEARELYGKFQLDEPWNSDANKQLENAMPKCFRCLNSVDSEETSYSVILGQEALFGYGGVVRDLDELRLRPDVYTNSQALIVERKTPVVWTRPDAELDAAACRDSFGKPDGVLSDGHKNALNVGVAGGAVFSQKTAQTPDETPRTEIIEALITGR